MKQISQWFPDSLVFVLAIAAPLMAEDHSVAPEIGHSISLAPNTSAQDSVLETINASKNQILVATHPFASRPIAKALADAHLRGVKVRVIADEVEARNKYSMASYLADRGVPVRLNNSGAIRDYNFLIVDDVSLELVGFNESSNAASGQSGSMHVRRDGKPIAGEFAQAWSQLWDRSAPLVNKY